MEYDTYDLAYSIYTQHRDKIYSFISELEYVIKGLVYGNRFFFLGQSGNG